MINISTWLRKQFKHVDEETKDWPSWKLTESIFNEIQLKAELEQLSNEELIQKAISDYTDWTMHPIVEVMMDRLSPHWADEQVQDSGEDK